uniref:Uncharacterized protein n=1 Tax=Glossina palpalis gambiensis TaxID=67801 RepID=A0A1B0B424_9MUSC
MERKKPCTAGTAYCSIIMRSFSRSNAGLCTSMGILPQAATAANGPALHLVSREKDPWLPINLKRVLFLDVWIVFVQIANSSSAHISISSDPPLTSAKSPIARRTFSTTPGFDSGSLSFGTKILRIGFIVINKALKDSGCANSASNVSSNERRMRTLTLQSMSVMATISKRSMTCDTVSIKVAEFSMVSAVRTASFNKCVQVPKVRRANTMVGTSCGKFIELSIGELTGNIPA